MKFYVHNTYLFDGVFMIDNVLKGFTYTSLFILQEMTYKFVSSSSRIILLLSKTVLYFFQVLSNDGSEKPAVKVNRCCFNA